MVTSLFVVVPEITTPEPPPNNLEWLYEGCNESKVCFGLPIGCIEFQNCNLFGAVTHDNGIFEFELLSIGMK